MDFSGSGAPPTTLTARRPQPMASKLRSPGPFFASVFIFLISRPRFCYLLFSFLFCFPTIAAALKLPSIYPPIHLSFSLRCLSQPFRFLRLCPSPRLCHVIHAGFGSSPLSFSAAQTTPSGNAELYSPSLFLHPSSHHPQNAMHFFSLLVRLLLIRQRIASFASSYHYDSVFTAALPHSFSRCFF